MPHDHDTEDHDRGLAFDVATLLDRRRALTLLGGAGLAALAGCGSSSPKADSATTSTAAATSTSAPAGSSSSTIQPGGGTATSTTVATGTPGAQIAEETAGPYPGDGSNGPNVLTESGIVRRDITRSFGSSSGTAAGVPLTVRFALSDHATGKALAGAAVYVWHCDREGRYSLYSQGATDQNYLRGVQVAGADGSVTFTSIFPAAYPGRWPHIHFEVYPDVAAATAAGTPTATSQIALPKDICDAVYGTPGYEASVTNMHSLSLATDMVFSDGVETELAAISGTVANGLTATLAVRV